MQSLVKGLEISSCVLLLQLDGWRGLYNSQLLVSDKFQWIIYVATYPVKMELREQTELPNATRKPSGDKMKMDLGHCWSQTWTGICGLQMKGCVAYIFHL